MRERERARVLAMVIFADLMATIPAYTGFSPTPVFTIIALLMALYYLVTSFFAAPKHTYMPMEPLPPPVQLGDVTEEELHAYNVSQSRVFYGPGGAYTLFAGRDASIALAKRSFEEQDLIGKIEGLSVYELDALLDWEWKFMSKYVKVGQIPANLPKPKKVSVTADASSATQENKNEKEERSVAPNLSGTTLFAGRALSSIGWLQQKGRRRQHFWGFLGSAGALVQRTNDQSRRTKKKRHTKCGSFEMVCSPLVLLTPVFIFFSHSLAFVLFLCTAGLLTASNAVVITITSRAARRVHKVQQSQAVHNAQ